MCPELEITGGQAKEIHSWVGKRGNSLCRDSYIDGAPGMSAVLYEVDKEPLVIFENRGIFGAFGAKIQRARLFCSDKHAQELEAKGIIRLPEPSVKER